LKFNSKIYTINNEMHFQLIIDNFNYFSVLFIVSRFNISLNKFIDMVYQYNGIYSDGRHVFFKTKYDYNNFVAWLESLLVIRELNQSN